MRILMHGLFVLFLGAKEFPMEFPAVSAPRNDHPLVAVFVLCCWSKLHNKPDQNNNNNGVPRGFCAVLGLLCTRRYFFTCGASPPRRRFRRQNDFCRFCSQIRSTRSAQKCGWLVRKFRFRFRTLPSGYTTNSTQVRTIRNPICRFRQVALATILYGRYTGRLCESDLILPMILPGYPCGYSTIIVLGCP